MAPRHLILIVIAIGWISSGCGMVRHTARPAGGIGAAPTAAPGPGNSEPETSPESNRAQGTTTVGSMNEVQSSLMDAYHKWKGTPYRLGGASQQGVDCSQLMHLIFEEYFRVELPPTTRTQLNVGQGIRRKAIRTGDLIFFRTGRKTLHVGVAVNHGEFLHASTSNGVMISKLGNSYWRSRYLEARRVL